MVEISIAWHGGNGFARCSRTPRAPRSGVRPLILPGRSRQARGLRHPFRENRARGPVLPTLHGSFAKLHLTFTRRGAAALAVILSLLDITPACSATPDVRSVTVSYRDLDLPTPRGAKVLYRRIRAAAREVCGYRGADLLEQSLWKDCYHHAIADAVGKVNNPRVTAMHTGRPPAMTAMLAKTPESEVGTSPGSGSL